MFLLRGRPPALFAEEFQKRADDGYSDQYEDELLQESAGFRDFHPYGLAAVDAARGFHPYLEAAVVALARFHIYFTLLSAGATRLG